MSKPLAVVDTECYRDYWLCKVRRLDTGAVRIFEQYPGHPLDFQTLDYTLKRLTLISFNGRNYDMPMIGLALRGASCEMLKRCSDFIILGNVRPWDAERQFNFKTPEYDHIDLIEIAPGMVSLKVYMGRLHCRKMQDLPIEPDASISPEQRLVLIDYNDNDLDGNAALYRKFIKQIELRVEMSKRYGIDLRSKSDAQIAEAVIKATLQERGHAVTKPNAKPHSFKFRFPVFLKHAGPVVKGVIDLVRSVDFIVQENGKVKLPKVLKDAKIQIGQGVYRMGNGGLHSSEKRQVVIADDQWLVIDRDVASYYPAIIINTGLYPRHLGPAFLDVYRSIRDQRIVAKRAGDKSTADTLKIVLNGSFGKFGNRWSVLYSPDLLIQTTVTGQLALLMLIEMLESEGGGGIRVVSANTDGIVLHCHRDYYDLALAIFKRWEELTGFETEETRYKALYSRDVNNYIALKEGGGVKLKGAYAEPEPVASSWPSPHNQICVTAVCDFLEHRIPVDLTVKGCSDIRQFVEVRTVKGGGTWRGEYLGKAVRWYLAQGGEPIYYKSANAKGNHNKVAGTDGCKPLMEMDGSMPRDLDHDAYIREALGILRDIGYTDTAPAGYETRVYPDDADALVHEH